MSALTFYDTLSDADWRRCDGSYARRQKYQTVRAAINLLRQQGAPAAFLAGMEESLRELRKEHRDTLKWRRAQEKRRAARVKSDDVAAE